MIIVLYKWVLIVPSIDLVGLTDIQSVTQLPYFRQRGAIQILCRPIIIVKILTWLRICACYCRERAVRRKLLYWLCTTLDAIVSIFMCLLLRTGRLIFDDNFYECWPISTCLITTKETKLKGKECREQRTKQKNGKSGKAMKNKESININADS